MNPLVKKPRTRTVCIQPTIVQCFLDANLRSSHNGLTEIGKKYDLDLPNLGTNQMVVFVNRRQTMMKVYVSGNTISHTKRDRISLSAIGHLAEAFGYKGEVNYDRALELSLRAELRAEKA